MGPLAEDSRVMLGNYEGAPQFIVTLADGIKKFTKDLLVYRVGVMR